MREILIDTNMLLAQFQRRLDLFGELDRLFEGEPHRFVVLEQCIGELGKISLQQGPEARAARSAAEQAGVLAAAGRLAVEKGRKGNVDEALLSYAVERGAAVATNDFKLKRLLREKGVRVATLRQDHLVLV